VSGFWSRVRERLFGSPLDYAAIWAEVQGRIAGSKIGAWKPQCGEGHDASRLSHFGGLPLLPSGLDWPTCGRCGTRMPFLLQVAAAELPAEARPAFPDGILQLFFCTKCFRWEPFSDAVRVRVLANEEGLTVAAAGDVAKLVAPRSILSWQSVDDYAEPDEALGLDELQVESLFEAGYPLQGDKLLGAPYWVQDPEFPPCRECGKLMAPLFQLDSNDNLDLMWGDAGVAHILWCPDHQHVLALVWQCH
jgi:hypothetical protein